MANENYKMKMSGTNYFETRGWQLRAVAHGGLCCGIKHIYNIPYDPDDVPWYHESHSREGHVTKEGFSYPITPARCYPRTGYSSYPADQSANGITYPYQDDFLSTVCRPEGEKFFLPRITAKERLALVVAEIRRVRPAGLIEIVLQDDAGDTEEGYYNDDDEWVEESTEDVAPFTAGGQNSKWQEILEGMGFKIVTVARNSNTKNYIYVYHLAYNDMDDKNKLLDEASNNREESPFG